MPLGMGSCLLLCCAWCMCAACKKTEVQCSTGTLTPFVAVAESARGSAQAVASAQLGHVSHQPRSYKELSGLRGSQWRRNHAMRCGGAWRSGTTGLRRCSPMREWPP